MAGPQDWKPTDVPQGLEQWTSECQACRLPRKQLAALADTLAKGRASELRLFSGASSIDPNGLSLKCEACKDTGLVLDPKLHRMLTDARKLVDRAPQASPAEASPPIEIIPSEEHTRRSRK